MPEIAPEEFINAYQEEGARWLSSEGRIWRGMNYEDVKAGFDEHMREKVHEEIQLRGLSLESGIDFNSRVLVTAASGAVPFAKILIGGVANITFVDVVLGEFGLKDQEQLDDLRRQLLKLSEVDKIPQRIVFTHLEGIVEETFKSSLQQTGEEHLHWLPVVGQAVSMMRGGYKTFKACRAAIDTTMTVAADVHSQLFVPLALNQKKYSGSSILERLREICSLPPASFVYQVPTCLACFMGPVFPDNRQNLCEYCISEITPQHRWLSHAAKPCTFKHHYADTQEHDGTWCSQKLLYNIKEKHAWGCIPCFGKYGGHKPKKCVYDQQKNCGFCGQKGHHASGCGARFFNAFLAIRVLKRAEEDMGPFIASQQLSVTQLRNEVTLQRYKQRQSRMVYGFEQKGSWITSERYKLESVEVVRLGRNCKIPGGHPVITRDKVKSHKELTNYASLSDARKGYFWYHNCCKAEEVVDYS